MAAPERPAGPPLPESGEQWPEWLTWRWRYGPIPPPWLERKWLTPPWEQGGGAPWPEALRRGDDGIPVPPDPSADPADRLPPDPAAARRPARPQPRVPLWYRLHFVLFGACFTVPSSLTLLIVFGRHLPWTTRVTYLLGGLLGLAGLAAFFLALTAPPPGGGDQPAA